MLLSFDLMKSFRDSARFNSKSTFSHQMTNGREKSMMTLIFAVIEWQTRWRHRDQTRITRDVIGIKRASQVQVWRLKQVERISTREDLFDAQQQEEEKNSFFADPTFFYFYGALMIIYYLLVWVHMSAVEGRSVLRWKLQVPCGIQRQPLQDASMLHRPLQCGTPEPPRQQTGCSRSGPGEKTGYLQNEQQQQQQLQKSQPICWARLK